MDDTSVQPASIPDQILSQPQSINLYFVAVIALATIGVLAVVGGLLLAWADKTVPGEIWTFAGLAVGGLVALVGSGKGSG